MAGRQIPRTHEAIINSQPGDYVIKSDGTVHYINNGDIQYSKNALAKQSTATSTPEQVEEKPGQIGAEVKDINPTDLMSGQEPEQQQKKQGAASKAFDSISSTISNAFKNNNYNNTKRSELQAKKKKLEEELNYVNYNDPTGTPEKAQQLQEQLDAVNGELTDLDKPVPNVNVGIKTGVGTPGDQSGLSAGLRRQGEMANEAAANEEQFVQQSAAIANQDYRAAADREALAKAAVQQAQAKRAMTVGAGAGAAALAAAKNVVANPDYDAHRQRQDAQRQQALEGRKSADQLKRAGEQAYTQANINDYSEMQRDLENDESAGLSTADRQKLIGDTLLQGRL